LIRLLADCPASSMRWAGIGYQYGVLDGIEQGIAAEEWAERCRWHKVHVSTRAVLDKPTRAELEQRRNGLPACRCARCSVCIRTAATAARDEP
jgi:hypothetical protein